MNKRFILGVVFLGIFLLLVFLFFLKPKSVSKNLPSSMIINKQTIFVELAWTGGERRQGLSGRESLAEDRGMLFIFSAPAVYPFWMNQMKFGLDFVFINGQEVVDLAENIPYPKEGEQPQSVIAKHGSDRVLEINAGMVQKWKIKIGDKVIFSQENLVAGPF